MAKKKKSASKPKGDGLYKGIGADLAKASRQANRALDLGPLSTVDASRSNETQNILNQLRAISDPNSASYAGRRSDEMTNFMGRLQDLTQGYDSQEMNALRSENRREMEKGFQTGTQALQRGQSVARTGSTQRGAQLLNLAKAYGEQSAAAENDLFVKGAQEKRRAIDEYGRVLNQNETNEYSRGTDALSRYSDTLRGADSDQFGRQKFNAGQEAASRALKQGGTMGILAIGESRRNAKEQNNLIRQGYSSNERIAGINASAAQRNAELQALLDRYASGGQ